MSRAALYLAKLQQLVAQYLYVENTLDKENKYLRALLQDYEAGQRWWLCLEQHLGDRTGARIRRDTGRQGVVLS